MIFVYIGVPVMFALGLGWFFKNKKDKQQKAEVITILEKYGELKHHHYHIGSEIYQVHFLKLNVNAELVINSPIMWEIHSGSGSKLLDQRALKSKTEKLIIVYPSVTPIKRYINENEMIFITYKHHFSHMRFIRFDELELCLELLKKEIVED